MKEIAFTDYQTRVTLTALTCSNRTENQQPFYIVLCFASLILWSLEKIDKEAAAVWNKLLKKATNKWCENTKAACVVYFNQRLGGIFKFCSSWRRVIILSFLKLTDFNFHTLLTLESSHTYLTKSTVFGEDMHPNLRSSVKWWAFEIPLLTLHCNF